MHLLGMILNCVYVAFGSIYSSRMVYVGLTQNKLQCVCVCVCVCTVWLIDGFIFGQQCDSMAQKNKI